MSDTYLNAADLKALISNQEIKIVPKGEPEPFIEWVPNDSTALLDETELREQHTEMARRFLDLYPKFLSVLPPPEITMRAITQTGRSRRYEPDYWLMPRWVGQRIKSHERGKRKCLAADIDFAEIEMRVIAHMRSVPHDDWDKAFDAEIDRMLRRMPHEKFEPTLAGIKAATALIDEHYTFVGNEPAEPRKNRKERRREAAQKRRRFH